MANVSHFHFEQRTGVNQNCGRSVELVDKAKGENQRLRPSERPAAQKIR